MATWEAQIRVVPTGGFMRVEVEAGSVGTARQTIDKIYDPIQVVNLREVRGSSSGGGFEAPSGGGVWLVGLIAIGAAFLYLTPYILSLVYGAGATWASQRIVNQTIEEYNDNEDTNTDEEHKKAGIVFGAALLFGLIGFVHGTVWHQDLKKQYIDDHPAAEVRKAQ
jgi:hypothetical protein